MKGPQENGLPTSMITKFPTYKRVCLHPGVGVGSGQLQVLLLKSALC